MTSFTELYKQISGHFSTGYQDSESLLENVFLECEKKIDWEKVFWENRGLDSKDISEESCAKLKDSGTKLFQKKQYSEAVRLYNDYIRKCHQLDCKPEQKRQLIYQGKNLVTLLVSIIQQGLFKKLKFCNCNDISAIRLFFNSNIGSKVSAMTLRAK